jgi:hypothetical protein
MDDLQFRRNMYADPNTTDAEMHLALKNDVAKQKFAQEVLLLDKKIASALDIPIPENLADKLLLRQSLASHKQQKRRSKVTLAIAASVTLALGFTLNFLQSSHSYTTVGDYAIAHVNYESHHYSNDMVENISLTTLNNKMASFDGSFNEQFGDLIMADFCRFDGMKSLHLIFKGEKSPVNIFVIPQNDHLTFTSSFKSKQLNGLAKDFDKNQIIVVGDKTESLEQWQQRIANNIRWST